MEITEHYEMCEIIGRTFLLMKDGSSCTVRRAIKRDTGQEFAVKVYEN